MKSVLSFLFLSGLMTQCLSQTVTKTAQTKTAVKSNAAIINPAVQQNSAIKTSSTSNAIVDSVKASLLQASFVVHTASNYAQDPGTNKAADTHWLCVLFDQNNREVASFQDNSNSDEYASGSQTPTLKMQTVNAATFADFQNGGHLHISIAPSGNDTWEISEFDLTLDFSSPKFSKSFNWSGIRLTQDSREIDVNFNQQNNSTLKYDLKANKKS